ncbi:MAG: hypothetical protein MZU97_12570 [Bacillus subtilis]|nr:hypothetical protein [Bacillus subtilis]
MDYDSCVADEALRRGLPEHGRGQRVHPAGSSAARSSVVGACTGFDAHTVGIDAIMNMKGYNHHYGLERYSELEAYNLGAQVPNEKLIEFARQGEGRRASWSPRWSPRRTCTSTT